jgi:hypothetical protein
LGKDRDEAFRHFHRLMAERGQKSPEPEATLTLNELAALYLADMERRADARTLYVARCYLKPGLSHGAVGWVDKRVRSCSGVSWSSCHQERSGGTATPSRS